MALGCPIGDAAPALSLQAAQPVLQMKLMSSVINLYLWRELLLPITYPPSLACDLAQGCWCPSSQGELEGVSGGWWLWGGDRRPWGAGGQGLVLLPGLGSVLPLWLVFNVLPPENERMLQLNERRAVRSSFANEQLRQPLQLTRGRGGEADDWSPSAAASSAIACRRGARGPENARAGRSAAGRMVRLCAAESRLVPCEGGTASAVAPAARAALGRERLPPRASAAFLFSYARPLENIAVALFAGGPGPAAGLRRGGRC